MFENLEVLSKEKHKDLTFSPAAGFGFARELTIAPVSAKEALHAAKFYPIVFSKDGSPMPQALLSLEKGRLTAAGGQFRINLSESEIESGFDQIKKYLLQYQDNLALREINRIMLSNASAAVKEKANLMKTFSVEPDFSTFRDPFSYEEVIDFPELYLGCYVIWAGKVANVNYSPENIRFDLLVGYHHEKELLGIAPTSFDFGVRIEDGIAVEVLAQIKVIENAVALRGVAVHRLRVRE